MLYLTLAKEQASGSRPADRLGKVPRKLTSDDDAEPKRTALSHEGCQKGGLHNSPCFIEDKKLSKCVSLGLADKVVVECHEEKLSYRILDFIAWQLTQADHRTAMKKFIKSGTRLISPEQAKVEDRREPTKKRLVRLVVE